MKEFVVFYKGRAIAVIKNTKWKNPSELLGWYSKHYGFPEKDLTWDNLPVVEHPSQESHSSVGSQIAAIEAGHVTQR